MTSKDLCAICDKQLSPPWYNPMKEWNMEGHLCGICYSQKISEHYPGKHGRCDPNEANDHKNNNNCDHNCGDTTHKE